MLLVLNRLDLTAHFGEGQLLTEHSDVSLLFKAELWHASDDAASLPGESEGTKRWHSVHRARMSTHILHNLLSP
jgi:hypothetical protein